MRVPVFTVIIVGMFAQHASAESSPVIIDRISIVVRVYQGDFVRSIDLDAAVTEADAILSTAGVDAQWRTCGAGSAPATSPCTAPLMNTEFAIRLVDGRTSPDGMGRLALGYSLIDAGTHAGSLATIHPDRVGWLAHSAGANVDVLLGRALAHEIGHLLLGSNEHRSAGIMRAVWSSEALQRNAAEDWTFTSRDAAEMRAAVETRKLPKRVASSIVWSRR